MAITLKDIIGFLDDSSQLNSYGIETPDLNLPNDDLSAEKIIKFINTFEEKNPGTKDILCFAIVLKRIFSAKPKLVQALLNIAPNMVNQVDNENNTLLMKMCADPLSFYNSMENCMANAKILISAEIQSVYRKAAVYKLVDNLKRMAHFVNEINPKTGYQELLKFEKLFVLLLKNHSHQELRETADYLGNINLSDDEQDEVYDKLLNHLYKVLDLRLGILAFSYKSKGASNEKLLGSDGKAGIRRNIFSFLSH